MCKLYFKNASKTIWKRTYLVFLSLIFIVFLSPLSFGQTHAPVTFSVMGDIPYDDVEITVLQNQIAAHNALSPSTFMVHLGDIKNGGDPCDESVYSDMASYLQVLDVPTYIIPGDNEYNDCDDPVQAWSYWEEHLQGLEQNWTNVPNTQHQNVRPENFAFLIDGVLFIGINLVGGFVHDQDEWGQRMQDDADWVEQQLSSNVSNVRAAVVFGHAGLGPGNDRGLFFDQFVVSANNFSKPILYVMGDLHEYVLDNPFSASNITRVQLDNGGNEDPIQITITLDAQSPYYIVRNPFDNPNYYTVTGTTIGDGDVDQTPFPASLIEGTAVQLVAVPNSGWEFSHWSGNFASTSNPSNFFMDEDKTITAHFTPQEAPISIALNKGWTWFSVNVIGDDMTLENVLSSLQPVEGDYIKNQTLSSTYYNDGGWFGNLIEIDPKEMYMIKLANAATLEFAGVPVDPTSTPVPINQGWTWIGYLPQGAMDITNVLSSLNLIEDDYIKSQVSSSTYYSGTGWFGSLNVLPPFAGFKIKKGNADVLDYPEGEASPRGDLLPFITDFKGYSLSPSDYELSGSITAQVLIGEEIIVSEGDKLLAYAGEECRGIASAISFPETGLYEFQIMVFSNISEGEDTLSFRYFDSENNTIYDCKEKVPFFNNMVLSDAYTPLELHLETALYTSEGASYPVPDLSIYPNPFTNSTMITSTIRESSMVRISVYDIYGQLVEVLQDDWKPEGKHELNWQARKKSAGAYFVKMSTETGTVIKKIIFSK